MLGIIVVASSSLPVSATPALNSSNSTTLLYDNPDYDIQIHYPQDWAYVDIGAFLTGAPFVAVTFAPAMDALHYGMMLQQSVIGAEMPPTTVTVVTMQLPVGNIDVQLLADYILSTSAPQNRGYQLLSTNPSAVLSGMPAYEAVALSSEPENNRTKSLVTMTVQEDGLYAVAYMSQESTFEQFLPIAREMISSFTIAH